MSEHRVVVQSSEFQRLFVLYSLLLQSTAAFLANSALFFQNTHNGKIITIATVCLRIYNYRPYKFVSRNIWSEENGVKIEPETS